MRIMVSSDSIKAFYGLLKPFERRFRASREFPDNA